MVVTSIYSRIHAFEIETVCHYPVKLIDRIGELVQIDFRYNIKTWHASSSKFSPAPSHTEARYALRQAMAR